MSVPEVGVRTAEGGRERTGDAVSGRPGGGAGGPDPATLAAIVAAVDATWPRAGGGAEGPAPLEPSRWRFSARWWSRPTASRRSRPW